MQPHIRRARSCPIPQVGLHVVVVADEIAAQEPADRVEDDPQTNPGANFVEAGGQSPQRVAAMGVRMAPTLRQRSQRAVDRVDFGGRQLSREAEKALGHHDSR